MAIKINISGVQMEGGKLLDGMKIGGDSNACIEIKDSSIGRNSQVLNDIELQNGTLIYRASDVNIDKSASVMNGRKINDGETVVVTQKGSNYTQTTQRAQPKQSDTETAEKGGFWQKLARTLGLKGSQSEITENKTLSSSGDTHTKFADQISGQGKYKEPEYSQVTITSSKTEGTNERTRIQNLSGR